MRLINVLGLEYWYIAQQVTLEIESSYFKMTYINFTANHTRLYNNTSVVLFWKIITGDGQNIENVLSVTLPKLQSVNYVHCSQVYNMLVNVTGASAPNLTAQCIKFLTSIVSKVSTYKYTFTYKYTAFNGSSIYATQAPTFVMTSCWLKAYFSNVTK